MASPPSIAHLINPFRPKPGSEWEYVQPITFESMRRAQAKAHASSVASVELLSAQFAEDREWVPEGFVATPDLERSVRDVHSAADAPPYPLIGDLMQRLSAHSVADYLIYTNVDIAVQPHFYEAVAGFIGEGLDAFIINRRRIPGHYRKVEELEEMYGEGGKKHPGFDCFVFRRELLARFRFAEVCIGIPFIGILTAQNLFAYAERFRLFEEAHLTFHIGEDVYKNRHPSLLAHNRREFWKAVGELWPDLDSRRWPYGRQWMPLRLVRWGLHPSLPIRLALRLEWRRWFGQGPGKRERKAE